MPIFFILCVSLSCFGGVIKETKQIVFEAFPGAFNPSILKTDQGILMSFRYAPDRINDPYLSFMYIVWLDEKFEPLCQPQLIETRKHSPIRSQSEDPRLFAYRGRIFLIYNDNISENILWYGDRRDMYMVELFFDEGRFFISSPLKLICPAKSHGLVEKNWTPFVWENKLFFTYSIHPHTIISPNLMSGQCYPFAETQDALGWVWGPLRGSSPPQLIDGEYLSFFHSGLPTQTQGGVLWHYVMGAYTFSAAPPFQMKKMTPMPLVGDDFYTTAPREKRVIFPGGYIVDGQNIYLAYGKDDYEMWIATIDRDELFKAMESL